MSILKRKIRIVPTYYGEDQFEFEVKAEDCSSSDQTTSDQTASPISSKTININRRSLRQRPNAQNNSNAKREAESLQTIKGTKVVRNYAKALCTFACSEMAVSYVERIISQGFEGRVNIQDFQNFISQKKDKTLSITSLRGLLMIGKEDNDIERIYKQIFSEISVVFIKFFSVNWIFSGKVKYRLEHMKYRHKMLRRIRNPELFTFLKKR